VFSDEDTEEQEVSASLLPARKVWEGFLPRRSSLILTQKKKSQIIGLWQPEDT
jgi:hypothetical protein